MEGVSLQKKRTRTATQKKAAAKKKNNIANTQENIDINAEAKSKRNFELLGLVFVAVGLISLCGIVGLNVGFVGLKFAKFLQYFFGIGSFIAAAAFIGIGGFFIMKHTKFQLTARIVGGTLFYVFALSMYHHVMVEPGGEILPENLVDGGGLIGGAVSILLHNVVGTDGTGIVLGIGMLGSFLVVTTWSLAQGILATKKQAEKGAEVAKKASEAAYGKTIEVGAKAKEHVQEYVQERAAEVVEKIHNRRGKDFLAKYEQDSAFLNEGGNTVQTPVTPAQTNLDTANFINSNPVASDFFNAKFSGNVEATEVPSLATQLGIKEPESKAEKAEDSSVEQSTDVLAGDKQTANPNTFYFEDITTDVYVKGKETAETAAANEQDMPVKEDWLPQINEAESEQENAYYYGVDAMEITYPTSSVDVTEDLPASDTADINAYDPLSEAIARSLEDAEDEAGEYGELSTYAETDEYNEPDELADDDFESDELAEGEIAEAAKITNTPSKLQNASTAEEPSADVSEAETEQAPPPPPYEIPPIHLLSKVVKAANESLTQEINNKAKVLAETLANFKVKASILNACHGPAVTRYEVKPAPGVKVSKITGLSDDIALNMAATAVRIEQIPGKSAIGIEVPNQELESVQLREVLENPAFEAAKSRLTVGLGKDISGQAIFADLAKMPHLLVAGATGSGKSVCINTLITSILFKAKPTEVKFILIDPKMVELSVYNDIPHLMVPVVTDAKRAASVLNWAVQEMEKRYGLIAQAGVRNMDGYNKLFEDIQEKQLPSIVIIIDELADLMMVAPHDVEDAICRIAQKARAAGIYLVLATQRPSVNVITGVIKANIPSRISFAVTSQIDSRTILDAAGAEKLLGKGDMLFKPQEANKPTRIQGAFVSDKEVETLVDYIKSQGHKAEANQEIIDFTNKAMEQDGEDEKAKPDKSKIDSLLRDAVELTMSSNNASASSFQRRYHIGYSRAGRLLDTMEQLGIVGPPQGSKPREILVTEAQAFEIMDNYENQ